ncbi:hypothetical protein [Streptomyces sp. NBC_00096]|uniref:hypothetical protein n=1 Tax=Streptomyces sp. NBC_00096 TaxID=2975650 RepID=UPI00324683C4
MNVDDIVAAKIAAARYRIQAATRRRAELAEARRHGIAARHAAKLRRQAAAEQQNTEDP